MWIIWIQSFYQTTVNCLTIDIIILLVRLVLYFSHFLVEFGARFISHLGGYNEKVIEHCFSTIINFDSMRF